VVIRVVDSTPGCCAAAEGVFDDTLRYVKERKVFGQLLASFQNTRFKLADIRMGAWCECGTVAGGLMHSHRDCGVANSDGPVLGTCGRRQA
jgi:hypothetical protein